MTAIDLKTTIKGLQEAQAANVRLIGALQPSGAFGRAIQYATAQAHRGAVTRTHVDSGATKAAHRMQVDGLRGNIYLDPSARNPRTKQLVGEYGYYEHERGGAHAFYARTIDEQGATIGNAAVRLLKDALP